jgi:drug/metabolite transporter (DMT)-like permease
MSPLGVAILAGLGGMLGWGFSEFATKKSVDDTGTISSLVWAHVFGTFILFLVLGVSAFMLHYSVEVPTDWIEWVGLAFFGVLQAIVYYFAYKGFEKGEVSILSPIFASFAGLVALFSIVLFGEAIQMVPLIALALIFMGIICMNLDLQSLKTRRIRIQIVPGLKEIFIATVLATGWTLGWDKFSGNKDWMVYTTFMFVFMTIAAFFIARHARVNLVQVRNSTWKYLWLIAIGEVVAYLAITLGYANTSYTSVVAVLSGASSLPTIVLARLFLKEKMMRNQMIAASIIIFGIAVLSIQ